MNAQVFSPDALRGVSLGGHILAHDVEYTIGGQRTRLRKGRRLTDADRPDLLAANRTIHLLAMEPGDVHEEDAARRLAVAVAGDGIIIGDPHESMITLRATHRGLLAVDVPRLLAINSVPDMSVWTRFDAQIVRERQAVAGVKVTPLVTDETSLREAEAIAHRDSSVLSVLPFVPQRVGVLGREDLLPAAGERFRESLLHKVTWFGSAVGALIHPENSVASVADAFAELMRTGSTMILCAGVTSTDPLDLTVQALDALGARWEKRGVPAHPGSTYWLAYIGDIPVLGMASCGMFSRATVLDLILPRFFAGQRVDARMLAALGHGGLLNKEMAFRFPDYASGEIASTEE